MNASNLGQRYRGPSNGAQIGPGPRLGQDIRNGSAAPGIDLPSASNAGYPPGAQMSRAEKFEDEKKRIIDSLFSKKDPDGSCKLQSCYKSFNLIFRKRLSRISRTYGLRKMQSTHPSRLLLIHPLKTRNQGSFSLRSRGQGVFVCTRDVRTRMAPFPSAKPGH